MRVDFQDLKAKVAIGQVLELFSIGGLAPEGDSLRGQCPFCQSSSKRNFAVNQAKGTWYCFHERRGGDVIRLAAAKLQCDDREAAAHLAKHLLNGAGKADDNGPAAAAEPPATSRKPSDFDPLAYLQTLDVEHEALRDLDIMPETLVVFQAGYSSKGLNRGRLAVAWHGLSGRVEMFLGVALDGSLPRYMVPKGQQLPYWFSLHRLEAEGDAVRILPDVLDVLRASENGCQNVICPLAPVDNLSLSALGLVLKERKLTVEF